MKSSQKLIIPAVLLGVYSIPSHAIVLDLDVAMDNVRAECSGIGSKIDHLKTLAGVNTGISAVGTVAGGGALAAGIIKAQKDKEIDDLLEKIATKLKNGPESSSKDIDSIIADLRTNWETDSKDESMTQVDKLKEQSKTLGNVRTGLLAANTATQVAGAAIASKTKIGGSLKDQINKCIVATDNLKDSMMQARLENKDTTKAKRVVEACGEYRYVDLSKINNLATGATITSSIGAVTGGAGTITSAIANTKEKETGLNTTANVMSGVSTATSAVSTVLNGVQIATIKKVVSTSDNCEKELQ